MLVIWSMPSPVRDSIRIRRVLLDGTSVEEAGHGMIRRGGQSTTGHDVRQRRYAVVTFLAFSSSLED